MSKWQNVRFKLIDVIVGFAIGVLTWWIIKTW
jgi:hypothetical protein